MNLNGIHIIHRGNYTYKYPENSIAAFRETLTNKLPIELDIHILKDNTIIVFHDDNLKRMCNIDIAIKNTTYKEIQHYKLKNTIYTIPTLKEVLDLVGGHVLLDIELKYDCLDGRLENELIKLLKNYNGEYILKSFHPLIIKKLKRLKRKNKMNFKIGLLSHKRTHLIFSYILTNPDFISYSLNNYNKNIFKFFTHLKPTLLYTFKNNEDIKSIKNFNGGYILEDYKKTLNK